MTTKITCKRSELENKIRDLHSDMEIIDIDIYEDLFNVKTGYGRVSYGCFDHKTESDIEATLHSSELRDTLRRSYK